MTEIEAEEIEILPLDQKKDLCLELLNEFGATGIRERRGHHELNHRCTLNLGGHSDGSSVTASVNYDNLQFNCYVCGNGGDLAWWIGVNRREDTDDVTPWLRKRLGIDGKMATQTLIKVIESIINPAKPEKQTIPTYNDKILQRWTDWPIFHPYLTEERHMPEATLKRFEVGYAPEDGEWKYHERIIIPCRWKGKLVGWQARRIGEGAPWDTRRSIKYQNSPGFPRNRILYGDVEERKVVLVESPATVLRHAHQVPIVATFGTNVTDEQFRLLERHEEITTFHDPGKPGLQWNRRIINRLSRKVRVNCVVNPFAEYDAGDLDDETFAELVYDAVPGAIWTPKRYSELR